MDKHTTLDTSDDELLPAPAPDRRRAVLVGVLAVTALGVGGVLLLGGAGQDTVDELPVAAPVAQVAATPSPTTSPQEAPAPPASSTARSARNPFQVLVGAQAVVPPAPAAAPTGAAPEAPTDEVLSPGVPEGRTGTGEAPPAAGVPTVEAPAPAAQLVLVGVQGTDGARSAVFSVGGTRQTVAVADSFGPDGSLLLLSLQEGPEAGQWTAVVQRGQADPFDVVSGQPVALA